MSAGGSLRAPEITLINYKGYNISKYVCPTDIIIDKKSTNIEYKKSGRNEEISCKSDTLENISSIEE